LYILTTLQSRTTLQTKDKQNSMTETTSGAESRAPSHNKKRHVIPAGITVCLDDSVNNRIAEIGFWPWFREACDAQEERFAARAQHGDTKLSLPEARTLHESVLRKTCEVCGRKFPSERASRKTCSERCKKRRQRRTV
jgi:hypothetical protein